ncbi:transcriptional regulator [Gulosibacter sp. 10]|uniref:transcriptional regulator n=1 Tax=Gulosibacter sp. 10 TaxID=1255570 RepID=UPI00097E8431|nr:transcriptional regulator [Gulosibacter sp. 10]SJM71547.1 hypothetical protein FM112_16455 [Gulosibacter sp. 10]
MTRRSAAPLLLLHAVRLEGFADSDVLAERAGLRHGEALRMLHEAQREGRVQHTAFGGIEGWSLTESGRAEDERLLSAELRAADPEGEVAAVYRDFLPLNARLLRAVTDWQLAPTEEDAFAPNDHADRDRDARILDELAALGAALAELEARLAGVLARLSGYADRYAAALQRARSGMHEWVDRTDTDSCHRVWFQLHEDLLATLGLSRAAEV